MLHHMICAYVGPLYDFAATPGGCTCPKCRRDIVSGDQACEILGESAAMHTLLKMIGRAVASDATVLITGETGTGKELVARALHQHSARVDKPFLAVNCAAIPYELL